jgi:hexosaminidase
MKIVQLIALLILIDLGANAQVEVSIIPQPAHAQFNNASFSVTSQTRILAEKGNGEALRIATMLANKLNTAAGLQLKAIESSTQNELGAILFSTQDADPSLGREGYLLSVTDKGVIVTASNAAGLFYGYQTICQLLPPQIQSPKKVNDVEWKISGAEIRDVPRFAWRGMHLDVGRHFVSIDFIRKYIDLMAMHKLNVFHWHLTEDQGWRIEIKKYPRLTEVGAWRKESLVGHYNDKPHRFDGIKHGGFYTQAEAKAIVAYAQERFIIVVPEIEMPGHASAAIAAYPELGVTGKQIPVATWWGVFPDIFNVEESTFTFLENVLTEVMEIFPSEYIHIGGDEAIKDQWKASDRVQQRMKEVGAKDENELQSYFVQRIEKFINSKGRKMVGWDEILEGGLAPNATVMSWRGTEGGVAAAKAGHDVIMTPIQSVYFWWYQGDPKKEPLAAGGYIPMQKVYEYEPVPAELTAEEAKHVLGAEACAWAEYMEDEKKVEYMVFPRMSALAEIVWSPKETKNWPGFKKRMTRQLQRYDAYGVNYAKSPFNLDPELEKANK